MILKLIAWLAVADCVLAVTLAWFISRLRRKSQKQVTGGETATLAVLLALPGVGLYGVARFIDWLGNG